MSQPTQAVTSDQDPNASTTTEPNYDLPEGRVPLPPTGDDLRPKSLFRRQLPCPPAISSLEDEIGRDLFAKALVTGNARCFFALVSAYKTQSEPAYCGLATLVICLNTFMIDPCQLFRPPWRFFTESMLSCCASLDQVKERGITLPELMCLAQCNGARVTRFERGGGTLEDFRNQVRYSTAQDAREHILVISYSRKELKQSGDGHYTVVGAYCEEKDALLVLDTARFKHGPHWVYVEDMYRAMRRIDPATNLSRGYFTLVPSRLSCSTLFTFRTRVEDWQALVNFFEELGRRELDGAGPVCNDEASCSCTKPRKSYLSSSDTEEESTLQRDSVKRAIKCFFKCMPDEVLDALTTYQDEFSFPNLPFRPRDHEFNMLNVKAEIEELPVYAVVDEVLGRLRRPGQNRMLSTILLLAFPEPSKFCFATDVTFKEIQDISSASELLQGEVRTLRRQMKLMMDAAKDIVPTTASSSNQCASDSCSHTSRCCQKHAMSKRPSTF